MMIIKMICPQPTRTSRVNRDSLRDHAGVAVGDVVVTVGTERVTTPQQFYDALQAGNAKKGVLPNLISQGAFKSALVKQGD